MNSHKDEIRESTGVQNFTHILLQKHETIRVMLTYIIVALALDSGSPTKTTFWQAFFRSRQVKAANRNLQFEN